MLQEGSIRCTFYVYQCEAAVSLYMQSTMHKIDVLYIILDKERVMAPQKKIHVFLAK